MHNLNHNPRQISLPLEELRMSEDQSTSAHNHRRGWPHVGHGIRARDGHVSVAHEEENSRKICWRWPRALPLRVDQSKLCFSHSQFKSWNTGCKAYEFIWNCWIWCGQWKGGHDWRRPVNYSSSNQSILPWNSNSISVNISTDVLVLSPRCKSHRVCVKLRVSQLHS